MSCPCESKKSYAECCQPFHLKVEKPPSAEALMRSRYAAYCKGLVDYLIFTTHREHPQYQKNTGQWRLSFAQYCRDTKFEGLTVVSTETIDDTHARVLYQALLEQGGDKIRLTEDSTFRCENGQWLYDGGSPRWELLGYSTT